MSNLTAVCPGSYDPITKGHEDIIIRAAKLFDVVYVAICEKSTAKNPIFTSEERVNLCKKVFAPYSNIKVVSYSGLTTDLCMSLGASVMVKGLRNETDFGYELNIADVNSRLSGYSIETVMLTTRPELSFISSSTVKELLFYGADISEYVPQVILKDICDKYKR